MFALEPRNTKFYYDLLTIVYFRQHPSFNTTLKPIDKAFVLLTFFLFTYKQNSSHAWIQLEIKADFKN